jgi:hypothetical protein
MVITIFCPERSSGKVRPDQIKYKNFDSRNYRSYLLFMSLEVSHVVFTTRLHVQDRFFVARYRERTELKAKSNNYLIGKIYLSLSARKSKTTL